MRLCRISAPMHRGPPPNAPQNTEPHQRSFSALQRPSSAKKHPPAHSAPPAPSPPPPAPSRAKQRPTALNDTRQLNALLGNCIKITRQGAFLANALLHALPAPHLPSQHRPTKTCPYTESTHTACHMPPHRSCPVAPVSTCPAIVDLPCLLFLPLFCFFIFFSVASGNSRLIH